MEVISELVQVLGATVILTGVDVERDLIGRVHADLESEVRTRVHDLSGEIPFPDFCALIEAADLVVTNNTGPMHIAAATVTPVVALFALTNPPEQWRPWMVPHRILNRDVPCRLCYSRVCPNDQECLRPVTAVDVIAAARDLGVGSDRQDVSFAARLPQPVLADG